MKSQLQAHTKLALLTIHYGQGKGSWGPATFCRSMATNKFHEEKKNVCLLIPTGEPIKPRGNLFCRPSWPPTQRSTCLCILSAGIKGLCHYLMACVCVCLHLWYMYVNMYTSKHLPHACMSGEQSCLGYFLLLFSTIFLKIGFLPKPSTNVSYSGKTANVPGPLHHSHILLLLPPSFTPSPPALGSESCSCTTSFHLSLWGSKLRSSYCTLFTELSTQP